MDNPVVRFLNKFDEIHAVGGVDPVSVFEKEYAVLKDNIQTTLGIFIEKDLSHYPIRGERRVSSNLYKFDDEIMLVGQDASEMVASMRTSLKRIKFSILATCHALAPREVRPFIVGDVSFHQSYNLNKDGKESVTIHIKAKIVDNFGCPTSHLPPEWLLGSVPRLEDALVSAINKRGHSVMWVQDDVQTPWRSVKWPIHNSFIPGVCTEVQDYAERCYVAISQCAKRIKAFEPKRVDISTNSELIELYADFCLLHIAETGSSNARGLTPQVIKLRIQLGTSTFTNDGILDVIEPGFTRTNMDPSLSAMLMDVISCRERLANHRHRLSEFFSVEKK